MLGLRSLLQPFLFREVDFPIDCPELAVLKLNPERVVSKGLNSGNSRESHTSNLSPVDFGDASKDLGLKPIGQLAVWSPSIVVG